VAALARAFADRGLRTLAVDCDPNPNLAESFGLDSGSLERFDHSALKRAGPTLELVREPSLVAVASGLWLLGGPPGDSALNDAVARGVAGVLLADRFDAVVTDLGAGPEFTRIAVGGVLNPADVCLVVTTGGAVADLTADRIEATCRDRGVEPMRVTLGAVAPERSAVALADRLTPAR
jgi:CO dehydrogenase nickel-insertion accessory protein CooC1